MSDQFWMAKNTAETVLHEYEGDSGLRIYQVNPEQIAIQIRSCGPVTGSRKGKTRPAFSMIQLDASEIEQVIKELKKRKSALSR